MGACRTASDFRWARSQRGVVVTEVRECRSIEATQLAEKISTEQRAEICQMATLLAQW